jgi:hypothetical protein
VAQQFPALPTSAATATRNTLQKYALVLSKVRSACSAPLPHFHHLSLATSARGFSTGGIATAGQLLELSLDLVRHEVVLESGSAATWTRPLGGDSQEQFFVAVLAALAERGIEPGIDAAPYGDQTPPSYDKTLAAAHHVVAIGVEAALLRIASAHARTAALPVARFGPRELWAHHFDLAMLWLSGQLVSGQNPLDAENADEQINFGFSFGDDSIPEPYVYVTAYPAPSSWAGRPLPRAARWHRERFLAAVLPYAAIAELADGPRLLDEFLGTAHVSCRDLMRRD